MQSENMRPSSMMALKQWIHLKKTPKQLIFFLLLRKNEKQILVYYCLIYRQILLYKSAHRQKRRSLFMAQNFCNYVPVPRSKPVYWFGSFFLLTWLSVQHLENVRANLASSLRIPEVHFSENPSVSDGSQTLFCDRFINCVQCLASKLI